MLRREEMVLTALCIGHTRHTATHSYQLKREYQPICVSCNEPLTITKTCLYNFDPFEPHFYAVKLGFTGVYIIFLISAQKHRLWVLVRTASAISAQKHRLWYSLEPPRRGGSNEYPQSMFLSRNMKNIRVFYLKIFRFGR